MGERRTRRTVNVAAAMVVMSLAFAACGNSDKKADDTTSGDTKSSTTVGEKVANTSPGVTDAEIRVGGIASVTNPLGGSYSSAFDGVQAYFDMINDEGGIYGRKLVLAEQRDDKAVNNKAEADALIAANNVFAVLPVATLLFTGADALAAAKMPTFGWTINPEWSGTKDNPKETLFGQTGSFLCFDCAAPFIPWLAKEIGAKKIGILAYSVPQSARCADGVQASFDAYGKGVGAEVAFVDKGLTYGEKNLKVQVDKMKSAGVDLVTTCMDTNGVVTLATAMDAAGLEAKLSLPNGYDHEFVDQFGDLFEGSIVRTDFVQWEVPEKEQPDGLKNFLKWMKKNGKDPNENAISAWLNAALFVQGLRDAGPTFTRESLVTAINKMTNWKADGLIHGVDWTTAHLQQEKVGESCQFVSTIENSEFVPQFTKPGKPFLCIDGTDPDKLVARNDP